MQLACSVEHVVSGLAAYARGKLAAARTVSSKVLKTTGGRKVSPSVPDAQLFFCAILFMLYIDLQRRTEMIARKAGTASEGSAAATKKKKKMWAPVRWPDYSPLGDKCHVRIFVRLSRRIVASAVKIWLYSASEINQKCHFFPNKQKKKKKVFLSLHEILQIGVSFP